MDKKSSEVLEVLPRILVEISAGEWFDRLSILQIKLRKWYENPTDQRSESDHARLNHLRNEMNAMEEAAFWLAYKRSNDPSVANLFHTLYHINEQLWDVEEKLRDHERRFAGTPLLDTPKFVEMARSVYKLNDQRHLLKNELTHMLGGTPEVKMLPEYKELTDARERLDETFGRRPAGRELGPEGSQP